MLYGICRESCESIRKNELSSGNFRFSENDYKETIVTYILFNLGKFYKSAQENNGDESIKIFDSK